MNTLEMIKRVLSFQDWKQASSLPGWRARSTSKKKNRIPFAGRGKKIADCRMTVEEFADKEKRNARYSELKSNKVPGLCKFSTIRANKSVWCVARS